MCLKKETNLTTSRKLKKKIIRKTNVLLLNNNFYSTGVKYNYVIYFLKYHDIKLNTRILSNLIKEELGFIFSLNNFVQFSRKKIY